MNNKGFIITITAIYYVIMFVLFLSLITLVVYKSVYTDKQNFQSSLLYSKFNSGESNNIISAESVWCSKYFYYDANQSISGYNNLIIKTYCEDYHGKRFV